MAQEPRQDHQPAKNNGLLAARSVRRRSRRPDPKKNTRRRLRKTCFSCEILDIALLALEGGPCWHRSGRAFGSAAFWCSAGSCSERPPSRQFLESFASEAFWVSGVLLPELGPWHGYYLGQRSPLGFPDLLPLRCEAPGWGGDARKSHRYLGGSELGLGTGTQAEPPTHEKQRPAGSEVGAPAKPAPRSQNEHPPEAENK